MKRYLFLLLRRGLAFCFDVALLTAFSVPAVYVLRLSEENNPRELGLLLWIWVLYFWIFEWLRGSTWGKFVFCIKVSRLDGSPLRWWQAAVRTLLFFFVPQVLQMWITVGFKLEFSSSRSEFILGNYLNDVFTVLVPLSVVVLGPRTSVADIVVRTKIDSQSNSVAQQPSPSRRQWILFVVSVLLLGLIGTWGTVQFFRLFSPEHPETAMREQVETSTKSPLLNNDELTKTFVTAEGEPIVVGRFNGKIVRKRRDGVDVSKDDESLNYSLKFQMPDDAGSFEEYVIMNNFSLWLTKLPADQRPRCIELNFIKTADVVVAEISFTHPVMVCGSTADHPNDTEFIDENSYVNVNAKFNPTVIGLLMTGKYEKYKMQFVERSE